MTDLSPETRALLRDADGADDPSPADRDRVRTALVAKIAAGAGATAAATVGTKTAAAATVTKTGLALKLTVAVALTTAAGTGVYLASRANPSPPTATATATATDPATATATATDPAPAPAAATDPAAAAAATDPVPVPNAPPAHADHATHIAPTTSATVEPEPNDTDSLERENAALRAIRAALRDRDGAHALSLIDSFDRDFPTGVLREEADALRIDALCAQGDGDAAREAAVDFTTRYPRSIHAAHVNRGCEGATP